MLLNPFLLENAIAETRRQVPKTLGREDETKASQRHQKSLGEIDGKPVH